QIGHVSTVVAVALFDHDRITHRLTYRLSPDCLRILFKRPGGKSSLGLPGTVTRPRFVGCLNWRWLPRVATKNQPSRLSIVNISRSEEHTSELQSRGHLVCRLLLE